MIKAKKFSLFLLLTAFTFSCSSTEEETLLETASFSEKATLDSCDGDSPSDKFSGVASMTLENKGTGSDLNGETSANGYCDEDYFTVYNNKWMVLTAPGGKDSRTELKYGSDKEVAIDESSDFRFQMVIENVPADSNNENKGVSIGQIHNRHISNATDDDTRPLVRIDATSQRGKIRVTFAHTYIKGESDSSYDLVNFRDRDKIYVRLVINSNGRVDVIVKNVTQDEYKKISYNVGNNWTDSNVKDGFYYKTGAYQQVESSGDLPRVSYDYFRGI